MAPAPSQPTNSTTGTLTQSRTKPQASRRKTNHPADDAPYHGVIATGSLAGSKRTAIEKVDGEPRLKRKRLEPSNALGSNMANSSVGTLSRKPSNLINEVEQEGRPSMVSEPVKMPRPPYVHKQSLPRPILSDGWGCTSLFKDVAFTVADASCRLHQIDFATLPLDAIHRYLTQFDIVPDIEPMATTAFDPPPPSFLLRTRGHRMSSTSPAPHPLPPTPANRPRRELSTSANRRRSSRLLDDDRPPSVTPVLSDIQQVHKALAQVVERHFRDHAVKEVDTLASFMCAVKAKG
jgi:hypothetical protein